MTRGVLIPGTEPELDALFQAVSIVCRVPVALVRLVNHTGHCLKTTVGLSKSDESPRGMAFCSHAIHCDAFLEVTDAVAGTRFADNPHVNGRSNIRSFAAIPVRLPNGTRMGTLCVMDLRPIVLSSDQRALLLNRATIAARLPVAYAASAGSAEATPGTAARSEAWRMVVDTVPALLAYWTGDLTCAFANRACEAWLGVS